MKHALAFALLIGCAGDGTNSLEGQFTFGWTLSDNSLLVTCEEGGVETIAIVTDDSGQLTTESFVCTDGSATTGPRAPATYFVTITALDATETVLATSSDQGTIVGGQTTDLDTFNLILDEDEVCDAASCPSGCCEGNTCITQTDAACGIGGLTCVNCANLGQVCNTTDGICIE